MLDNFDENYPSDPNVRIAPWFNTLDIKQQLLGKELDFKNKLMELDIKFDPKKFESGEKSTDHKNVFVQSFDSVYGGIKLNGYRNKNKFVFGYSREYLRKTEEFKESEFIKLGFIGGNFPTSYIVDPSTACAIDDNFKNICSIIENIIKDSNIKPFMHPPYIKIKKKKFKEQKSSKTKHQGVWKYLTVRRSSYEEKYIVILTNYTKHIKTILKDKYDTIIKIISLELNKLEYVKSFCLIEYEKSFEPQTSDMPKILFSKEDNNSGYIYEKILDKIFVISPNSFFQVNTETTIILYEKIREMLKPNEHDNQRILIDLYCGTGSIGLCMADMFDKVIGVDVVDSCIQDAKFNAVINKIDNASFFVGRCENLLDQLNSAINSVLSTTPDAKFYIVVDPAREGLHKKVRKFISLFKFSGFVYCSCNVNTWMHDVEDIIIRSSELTQHKIKPQKTLIVDMFPHTQHYEVLSYFTLDGN